MFGRRNKGPWPPSKDEDVLTRYRPIIATIHEVVTGGILRAGKINYGSGTGWWLGKDPADNEAKFDIGTPTDYFRYDETNGVQIAADGSGMTNIDGGNITAASVILSKLATAVTDRMFNSGTLSDNIQAWIHANDATLIDGGDIYTGSILVAGLNSGIIARMFGTAAKATDIQAWIHANDATLIDGGKIYTNTVTADAINVTNLQAVSANTGALTVDNTLTMGQDGIITWMSGAAKITDDYMDVALTTTDRYAFRFLDSTTVHAYLAAYKSTELTQISIEAIGPAENKYAKIALATTEFTGADPETVDMIIRSDKGVEFSALNYGAARIFKVDSMDAEFTNDVRLAASRELHINTPDTASTASCALEADRLRFRTAANYHAGFLMSDAYELQAWNFNTNALAAFKATYFKGDNLKSSLNYIVADLGSGQLLVGGHGYATIPLIAKQGHTAYAAFQVQKNDGTVWLAVDPTGELGIGTASPASLTEWNMTTENLEFVDAGSTAATEQDWIQVEVGGVTGYIRVFAAK